MKKPFYLIFSIILITFSAHSQMLRKNATAVRTSIPPKIDGIINENCWDSAVAISDFIQYDPVFNGKASQKTEVRILYDNKAIYVAAMLYDTAPDSILCQLGNRDEASWLNSDYFAIKFDTYNKQNDAYTFVVSASGIQSDHRQLDYTYDAVWHSASKVNDKGWSVEMKIPYSAIRFPKTQQQSWGLQIIRSIRRTREFDYWALEDKGAENRLKYWGILSGIENIVPPPRLSFIPYISTTIENQPSQEIENKKVTTYSYSAGMDLKYGINESFTLDMILLPDFSDVKSDNLVKNLSAFETYYSENRPFFNEAVDLFQTNGLFYSRRIGGKPINYYTVESQLPDGAELIENPATSRLINATKISGKTNGGLAVGLLNAITAETYATYKDSTGNKAEIMTNPLTNYNIVVLNQTLRNNSSVHIINTNVSRNGSFRDANVSGCGLTLYTRDNKFRLSTSGNLSQLFEKFPEFPEGEQWKPGYNYSIFLGKVSGRLKYNITRDVDNKDYYINDFGMQNIRDISNNSVGFSYNFYEPVGYIKDMTHKFWWVYNDIVSKGWTVDNRIGYNFSCTLKNYLSLWTGINYGLSEGYDLWEPRIAGQYYLNPQSMNFYLGGSSDYRKKISLDWSIDYSIAERDKVHNTEFRLTPIFRVNNHFQFSHTLSVSQNFNNRGFAAIIPLDGTDRSLFGNRQVDYYENTFSGRYIFKNDLSVSINIRHYWAIGEYDHLFLLENGRLKRIPEDIDIPVANVQPSDFNFNFNTFNLDFAFNWQFLPGSNLGIVWKNSSLFETATVARKFSDNLKNVFDAPHTNILSIKAVFYIDYLYFSKKYR